MEYWRQIAALALAGTEQGPLPDPPVGSPLADALTLPAGPEPEQRLLLMAGATALYQRAGWRPPALPVTPLAPAPEDTTPACSSRGAALLARLLDNRDHALLTEWLALATRAPVRIPHEWLPALLELGRKSPELIPAILPVLGERGRWLARQNPAWAPLRFEDGDDVWRTAAPAVRAVYLGWRRGHDPNGARALLEAAWEKEARTGRAAVVTALETGLSIDDEPFLEAALDHPSEEVRRSAAGLLSRLPESRLVGRMEARARNLITWAPGRLAQSPFSRLLQRMDVGGKALSGLLSGHLVVIPPGACDATMARDGLTPWPSANEMERAVWFQTIVAATPPGRWVEWTGRTERELLHAAGAFEHETLAPVPSWRLATERFRDTTWARAFFDAWRVVYDGKLPAVIEANAGLFGLSPGGPPAPAPGAWLDLLPGDEVERLVLFVLSSPPFTDAAALAFLGPWRSVWTEATGRAALVRLGRAVGNRHPGDSDGALWRERLPDLAMHLPPSLAPELPRLLPADTAYGGAWDSYLNRFSTTLNLRHEMHQEFAQ